MELVRLFESEEKEILCRVERFHETLKHLRYEGKVSHGKNAKKALREIKELELIMHRHRKIQEKVIFPFLAVRLPKHESVIHFLLAEHGDMDRSAKKLHSLFQNLLKKPEQMKRNESWETGIYFVCLLRHHLGLENKSIHKAIHKEFRQAERRAMEKKIKIWLEKGAGKKRKKLETAQADYGSSRL